jgi:hypothetical protein
MQLASGIRAALGQRAPARNAAAGEARLSGRWGIGPLSVRGFAVDRVAAKLGRDALGRGRGPVEKVKGLPVLL